MNRDWKKIVSTCSLEDWKEALAGLLTYTSDKELFSLCDELGSRLESNESSLLNACVCYIFSSNLDNFINCWQKLNSKLDNDLASSSSSLQDLIEKIMLLKCSLGETSRSKSFERLNSKLVEYAKLLADQGCFLNAYSYINDSNDSSLLVMKDRLYHVLDANLVQQYRLKKPEYPFKSVASTMATNAKSNIAHTQTQPLPSQTLSTRKPSYPTVTDRSVTPTMMNSSYGGYPANSTSVNNKIMSVNHPMPLNNIYSSQYNPPQVNQPQTASTFPSNQNNVFAANHPSMPPSIPTTSIPSSNPTNVFNPSLTSTSASSSQSKRHLLSWENYS